MGQTDAKRRSWLMVPLSRPAAVDAALVSAADVIVLDLVELLAADDKHAAREQAPAVITRAAAGGAAVFAMIDPRLLYADLHACVWPGLGGVVISRLETTAQVNEAVALIEQLEAERGLLPGTVEIVGALETAPGNHAAYELAIASPRVRALTLGRADLIMDLRPEPSGEIHLMPYLMQRLILIAGAAGVTPLGAWWRAPDRGLLATRENTLQAARRGRAIGFKGSLCLRPEQAEALNLGFAGAA